MQLGWSEVKPEEELGGFHLVKVVTKDMPSWFEWVLKQT